MQHLIARGLVGCALLVSSQQASAFSWQDLWKRTDQQVQDLIEEESYEQASALANTPEENALINFRAGEYAEASEFYKRAQRNYNLGTSLVRAGDYAAAIEAYDQALAKNPEHEQALHNKNIAQQLAALQQQQQEQNGDGEGEGQGDSEPQQGDKPADSEQQSDGQSNSESGQQNENAQNSDGESPEKAEDNKSEQDKPSPAGDKSNEPQDSAEQQSQQAQAHDEKQQAMDQWLQQVPDDPAGLLRARIIREHQRNYSNSQDKEQAW